MPCDNNCKSHIKATQNGIVEGHRLMIGEVFCKKAKQKLTGREASSDATPIWCPQNIDKKTVSNVSCQRCGRMFSDPEVDDLCPLCRKKQENEHKKNSTESMPQIKTRAPASMSRAEHVQHLVSLLNQYRNEYYNLNSPSISDSEYDRLFDELSQLERETNFVMSNSPTQTVGYKAVGDLELIAHPIALLSLDKTKSFEDIASFAGSNQTMLMHKLDGLTVKLDYNNGLLECASTRGDGNEGEIITHNIPAISGIPIRIPYQKRLVIVGEAYIHRSDFEMLKDTLLDSRGKPYRNARNLAAGSVRCLNAEVCAKRLVHFIPFNVLEGLNEYPIIAKSKFLKLRHIVDFGFSRCECLLSSNALSAECAERMIVQLEQSAKLKDIPIDGIVCTYNDIDFSKSCGRTGHHYKDGLAFKFQDEEYETVFRAFEWTPTRSGEISAVAAFDPVEIDGCEVSHATLHNLTIIRELELMPGCRIMVSKRNKIIPHIEGNLDRGRFCPSVFPAVCPCCGQPTRIQVKHDKDRDVETLRCDNQNCEMQRLRQYMHFVGKKALNIEGLSEATLERFIGRGWIHTFIDIFHLNQFRQEIVQMEGFGEKSYDRLWDAIEKSRNTTFERFLVSMDIPMIGRTASKKLGDQFGSSPDAFETAVNSGYDFTQLSGFGITYHNNIHNWFADEDNLYLWKELQKEVNIKNTGETVAVSEENMFAGKNIVATGKLKNFTRYEINAKITSLGANAGNSVSKSTDYVIYGEKAGSKLTKARTLGITTLTEDEFLRMIRNN